MQASVKVLLSFLPLTLAYWALAEKPATPHSGSAHAPHGAGAGGVAHASAEMVSAAQDFLASLDAEQRAKAVFDFKNEERENWKFTPVERKGLQLKEMRPEQRYLAMALLSCSLSNEGLRKVNQIMSLEKVLYDLENQSPKRDPERYFVSIFGTPSLDGTWAWRYEGHHLSMNLTLVKGQVVSLTPTFLGANPGVVKIGPRQGLQVLEDEDAKGIALFQMLKPDQQAKASLAGEVPNDIFSAEKRSVDPLEGNGLPLAEMDTPQQAALNSLLEEYVRRYRPELADAELAAIKATDPTKISFSWIGAATAGQPHYYRVQGPTFLFEYDNIQNDARHPHAVWREFKGDFGRDVLAEHYEKSPH